MRDHLFKEGHSHLFDSSDASLLKAKGFDEALQLLIISNKDIRSILTMVKEEANCASHAFTPARPAA